MRRGSDGAWYFMHAGYRIRGGGTQTRPRQRRAPEAAGVGSDPARDAAAPAKRFHLAMDDDVVDGPSIGPRTAERLYRVGINTVRDLINADVEDVAEKVDARHITPQTLTDWQDQALLVLTIPHLRGTHAQLLVGAGFRSAPDIREAGMTTVMARVLRFCASRDGQRILREGPDPAEEKIRAWVENAADAEPDRAQ